MLSYLHIVKSSRNSQLYGIAVNGHGHLQGQPPYGIRTIQRIHACDVTADTVEVYLLIVLFQ